ncbi:recombinase family protein [Rufibacter immobilis]|nr:recombinase family protein [Rufibacter immobilis]
MKRVAIYARVSTIDKDQNPETQLVPLREYCTRRNYQVVAELVDQASGKRTEKRPAYKQLQEITMQRKVDVVLVFRYDRFARSMQELVTSLANFNALGVDFISYMEQVDTTTAHGKLFFHMIAGMAEFGSQLISENVKAGMARAKGEGKRISRPRLDDSTRLKILELHKKKKSPNQIAKALKIGYGTVYNYLKEKRQAEENK